jgi:hypothetical protein
MIHFIKCDVRQNSMKCNQLFKIPNNSDKLHYKLNKIIKKLEYLHIIIINFQNNWVYIDISFN